MDFKKFVEENNLNLENSDELMKSIEEVSNVEEALANGGKYIDKQQVKVEIGQTMAFIVLALSELVHVFNIRNNKKSVFKTGIKDDASIMEITTTRNVFFIFAGTTYSRIPPIIAQIM